MRGSITVFSALCMMLVASLLLALLESARVYGLDACADSKAEIGLESVCAEYQPVLWEDYHILGIDGAYGSEVFSIDHVTGRLYQYVSNNLSRDGLLSGADFFQMEVSGVVPVSYALATDEEGSVFWKLLTSYMEQNLSKEAAELIYERYRSGQELEENAAGEDHSVEEASRTIEEAKTAQEAVKDEENAGDGATGDGESSAAGGGESGTVRNGDVQEAAEPAENPLEIVLELKRNAILSMVVEEVSTVSTKQIEQSDMLLARERETGNAVLEESDDWYERILVLEYIGKYFSDYTNPSEDHALAYEMEYILCGKTDDKANLEGTVTRLLLFREAANIVHIASDSGKRNEAMLLAEALAGFTGNPAIIKVVQAGIIAAWAYMESVQDVRALLAGDKIALIKSKEQWTLDTGNLLSSFQSTSKAKNCENGLSYQGYLKFFLFLQAKKELSFRMMDIMEKNIRLAAEYQNFRMDHLICYLSYDLEFEAVPLFSGLVRVGRLQTGRFVFRKTKTFSYIL